VRASITHVLGARRNSAKAASATRALSALGHEQRIIHTAEHYNEIMRGAFFVHLGRPEPDVSLGVGSGSHADEFPSPWAGHADPRIAWIPTSWLENIDD
jgi:UDP-N-acetylglucosamine 2-epimerase